MDDGAVKIFLCSDGELNNVEPDFKAFRDYMKGLPSKDDFVTEIDNLIAEIKSKEERMGYMRFEMQMLEAMILGVQKDLLKNASAIFPQTSNSLFEESN